MLGLGAPAAAAIACVASEAGGDDVPIFGRNSVGGYSNGTAAIFPPTCVIQLNAWTGPNCLNGPLLDQAFVPVSGCTLAPPVPPAPVAPSGVTGNPQSPGTIQAVWSADAPQGAMYNVYYCQTTAPTNCGPGGDPIHFAGSVPPATAELLLTGLNPGKLHNVKVCADTPPHPEACPTVAGIMTPAVTPPAAPTVSNVSLSEQKVQWVDSNGDSYRVRYCQLAPVDQCNAGQPNTDVASGILPGVMMVNSTGLMPGTTYRYDVCAVAGSEKDCSGDTDLATAALTMPTALSLAPGPTPTTEIKASWTDSNGDDYEVFYCEFAPNYSCAGGDEPNTSAGTVGPGVGTFLLTGLTPGGAYHVNVCARVGGKSECAAFTGLSTDGVDPPTAFELNVISTTSIQAAWTDSNGEAYDVFYCEVGVNCGGGGEPTLLAGTASPGDEMFLVDGLMSETTYNIEVFARVNPSAGAGFLTATTPPGGLALVAQTGISICFDAAGFVIACPALPPTIPGPAAGSGQDGAIMAGQVPASPRYLDGDARCGGLAGVHFLDTLTDLCFLYDPCNAGGVCGPVAEPNDWDTLMLGSTEICDVGVDAACNGTCSGADGSAPGDWRIANMNETFSQVGWENNGSVTGPQIPQELIDLILPTGALGCWDRILWTSTTAQVGVPPASLLPTAGAYDTAYQMDWSSSGFPLFMFDVPKLVSGTGLLVKDPVP